MSFFKNVLASIGVGAATVNTILDNTSGEVRAGGEVCGRVVVTGGDVPQEINAVYLYLTTSYIREVDDKKIRENGTISRFALNEAFTIQANTTREIPFSFMIPYTTPISAGGTQVWVKTGLDIASALDAADHDYIKVLPHPIVANILDAMALLGFRLRQVECEYAPRSRMGFPFVQEFEFKPGREFRGLDELEVAFFPHEDHVEVFMEIDRKSSGIMKLLDLDETRIRFTIREEDVSRGNEALAEHISQLIRRYM
ncbi:sporulation protein [Paenibacillus xerothermodurans]|uniref:Sporulation protein SpoOM n=1 Tax=Paenibacillus xerothermodurans TaxID=1977292 RepID=A0A2W1NMB9_PAEXE|nr:sporulation protein [Paenibacillus xerothermodurans]PZE20605.1 sporulation protein SpoOM [Paenibacillus xerothermodurans]